MSDPAATHQNRREMFRSCLRYLALGGISWVSARLISRGAGSPAADGYCWSQTCGDCAAVAGCELPQAQAAKRTSER